MTLQDIRLLVDFGFVILIWAVQLVIYPSFSQYSNANLFKWHKTYTQRVTFIVLPLMIGQLVIVLFQLFQNVDWYTICSSIIIGLLWLLTFTVFVPLHQSIDKEQPVNNVCLKLVSYNWIRTLLWNMLFLLSLLHHIKF